MTAAPWRKRWKRLAAQIQVRDGRRCRACGTRDELSVHHILPRAEGGTDDGANLVTLCEPCHNEVEQVPSADGWRWIESRRRAAREEGGRLPWKRGRVTLQPWEKLGDDGEGNRVAWGRDPETGVTYFRRLTGAAA